MPVVETKIASTEHVSPPEALKPLAMKSAAGTSAIKRGKQADLTSLTKQQIKDYGLPVDMEGVPVDALAWVRNKDANIWKDAPEDRISQMMSDKDAEVVRHGGKVVVKADCVLMRYPAAYREQAQKETDAEADRLSDGLHPGAEGALQANRDFDAHGQNAPDMTKAEKLAWLARMHDYHMNSGMIGPTRNMSLADAIRVSGGVEAAAREEDRYRQGSAHRETDQEEWAAMFAPTAPTSPAVRAFYGMGNTGLGPTTAQKVAAKSATGRRGAALAASADRK